jgi:hypothetical protein
LLSELKSCRRRGERSLRRRRVRPPDRPAARCCPASRRIQARKKGMAKTLCRQPVGCDSRRSPAHLGVNGQVIDRRIFRCVDSSSPLQRTPNIGNAVPRVLIMKADLARPRGMDGVQCQKCSRRILFRRARNPSMTSTILLRISELLITRSSSVISTLFMIAVEYSLAAKR